MHVSDFDYTLPPDLIAQTPAAERDAARLLVLDRATGRCVHSSVGEIHRFLAAGDLVVVNDTKVFPARLLGRRVPSGGAVECLLLHRAGPHEWMALVHPGQKLRVGERVRFDSPHLTLDGEILERRHFGRRLVRLTPQPPGDVDRAIDAIGHVPLPPYIRRADRLDDRERYQTVYARSRGSVAAPTAGLHLTSALLARLASQGVAHCPITLHIGYGTFKPVRATEVEAHTVDPEPYAIPPDTADAVNRARAEGRRVVAVGTTSTRALEAAALEGGGIVSAGPGMASVFIYPGFTFRVVGGLLTNFHLPQSSLLMLVCALGGREPVLAAYREAVRQRYRFYSYGDAMLVL